jgi:hypothetical protein
MNRHKNSMKVSGVDSAVSGVDLEVSDFCYPPETSFFTRSFGSKMLWNGCQLEVSVGIFEISGQQSGILGYRDLEFYKNLRNSYQNFGRAETGKFYDVSSNKMIPFFQKCNFMASFWKEN